MEEHKWRYMLHFFCRAPRGTNYDGVTSRAEEANDQGNKPPSGTAWEECFKAISGLEKEARACYAENINLDKHRLVEVLLLDGCFILELFIKHADQNQDQDEELDPIINNLWMVPTLRHDLALLENQIPIQTLAKKKFRFSLEEYVLLFFRTALNLSDEAIQCTYTKDLLYIAHLLHRVVYTPLSNFYPQIILEGQGKFEWGFKRCATQLANFGILHEEHRRLLDITFGGGVITIPPLYVHEITYSIFRNLVAFEQCSAGCWRHMASSYAWLMNTLIRSSRDTKLLRLKGIIISNEVGDDEEVSTFFQSLCRVVVLKEFCFSDLCEEVNTYDKSVKLLMDKDLVKVRCNGYIATLHNDYFNSPWSFICFIAAFVGLCLTALGTCYTLLIILNK